MAAWADHKALFEKRAAIAAEQTELVELAAKEARELTTEEETKYQTLEKAYQDTDRQVKTFDELKKRAELLADRQAHHKESGRELDDRGLPLDRDKHGRINDDFLETEEVNEECRTLALEAFLLSGSRTQDRVTKRHRQAADMCGVTLGGDYHCRLPSYRGGELPKMAELRAWAMGKEAPQQRINLVGTDTTGGYFAPESFVAQLEIAMLAFGGIRGLITILRTEDGNDLRMPSVNDTANKGRLVGEGAASTTDVNINAGSITLRGYEYTSDAALVTTQLLRDSAIDVVAEIGRMLGERLGRIIAEHLISGDGAAKPRGITLDAPTGVTAASATALTDLELVSLRHSVDPAYRNMENTYVWNDSTLEALKKLTDGMGRRLWQSGVAVGEPDSFDGVPYQIDQDMAAIATGNTSVIYGALRKMHLREVRGIRIHRLVERYRVENDADGFIAFMSADAKLRDAGTNPVKKLVHP